VIPPSDNLNLLPGWLLVVEGYDPETAGPLLRALHNLDDESARVTVRLWALEAEHQMETQLN